MELNVQSEHSSAKHEKEVKVRNSTQHLTGCIFFFFFFFFQLLFSNNRVHLDGCVYEVSLPYRPWCSD